MLFTTWSTGRAGQLQRKNANPLADSKKRSISRMLLDSSGAESTVSIVYCLGAGGFCYMTLPKVTFLR